MNIISPDATAAKRDGALVYDLLSAFDSFVEAVKAARKAGLTVEAPWLPEDSGFLVSPPSVKRIYR
jgi:hypothetical protein